MGNQGRIAKQQSGKIYVFLHISVLSFIFEKKNYYCKKRNRFSVFTSVFESVELSISQLIGAMARDLLKSFGFNRKKFRAPTTLT